MTFDDLLIDKRIVRRNLERGRLDTSTYQRMLADLPDRSGNLWRPEAASAPEPVRAPAAAAAPPSAAAAVPAEDEEQAEPSTAAPFSPMAPS
jgi:hypothetical protein